MPGGVVVLQAEGGSGDDIEGPPIKRVVPLDNSDPSQGVVTIRGAVVTIDPYDEFGYNRTVNITIPPAAFADVYFRPHSGILNGEFQYRTTSELFHEVKGNIFGYFFPREGASLHYINGTLFYFGGRQGVSCFPDMWISRDRGVRGPPIGNHWEEVKGPKTRDVYKRVPMGAFAPTALDRWGCMWLLGGDCSQDTGVIWRTCDIGAMWYALPPPSVVPFGRRLPERFPPSFRDHAIVIVGGWQLLIVDASPDAYDGGGVWRATDKDATFVQKVPGPLPFPSRKEPHLVASSESFVYLIGGHVCNDIRYVVNTSCNAVFGDVWWSTDVGVTWNCLTASYAPTAWSPTSAGVARRGSVVMTADDYIFILGGIPANSSRGLNNVYSSYGAPLYYAHSAHLGGAPYRLLVRRYPPTFTYIFREAVQAGGSNRINLMDYGADGLPGGVTSDDIDRAVDVVAHFSGATITITPTAPLAPGRVHRFDLLPGAAQNVDGVDRGSSPQEGLGDGRVFGLSDASAYFFTSMNDVTPPTVTAVYPFPFSQDIAPWTNIMLTMSEEVWPGAGFMILRAVAGVAAGLQQEVLVDVAAAEIRQNFVFLRMPPQVRLTPGQTYEIALPVGFLRDEVGNELDGVTVSTFTVLSALWTHNRYDKNLRWPAIEQEVEDVKAKCEEECMDVLASPFGDTFCGPRNSSGVLNASGGHASNGRNRSSTSNGSNHSSFNGSNFSCGNRSGLNASSEKQSNVSDNSSGNVTNGSGNGSSGNNSSNNSSAGKGGIGNLLRREESFAACVKACVKTALTRDDTQAPALLRVHPPPGSTDVPPVLGIAVFIFFSEPVVFNDTGVFNFSTPDTSYTVNLSTNDNEMYLDAMEEQAAVRIVVPPANRTKGLNETILKKGVTFTLSIPEGIIVDLAGNPAKAIETHFTTLALKKDFSMPQILMVDPPDGSSDMPGGMTRVTAWFSEDVEPFSGGVRVQYPPPDPYWMPKTPDFVLSIEDTNITVGNSKMVINFPRGLLNMKGMFTVVFPKGVTRDLLRILPASLFDDEGGENPVAAHSVKYTMVPDHMGPIFNVSLQSPPHEEIPTYQQPTTASFVMVFNEVVQAGTGSIHFLPRHLGPVLDVVAADAIFDGPRVFVLPPEMQPGQVYEIVPDNSSFKDTSENMIVGMTGPSRISTVPRVRFREVARRQWGDRVTRSGGERYNFAATVDDTNRIFVLGGVNGTPEAPLRTYLNDVWQLQTSRAVNCGGAYRRVSACSAKQCSMGPEGEYTLGTALSVESVFQSGNRAGRRCVGLDGRVRNGLGDVLSQVDVSCPCPFCAEPPGPPSGPPLPEFMPNIEYVRDYLIVNASNETRPLLCDGGRAASGPFICEVANDNYGRFRTPYPMCEHLKCKEPPDSSLVAMFAAYEPTTSTDGLNCSLLSEASPMAHLGSCMIRCAPGWRALDALRCDQGNFHYPTCGKQSCTNAPSAYGRLLCEGPDGPVMGTRCSLLCDAGYTPSVIDVNCTTSSLEPEAPPTYVPTLPRCVPTSCGNFKHTVGASISYTLGTNSMGDAGTITCTNGYEPWGTEGGVIICGPMLDMPGQPSVEWQFKSTLTRAGPMCVKRGMVLEEQVHIGGAIYMDMTSPKSTPLASTVCDASFDDNLALSVAASLNAASASPALRVQRVQHVSVDFCQGDRRLAFVDHGSTIVTDSLDQHASPRRTQGDASPVVVNFTARTANMIQADGLRRAAAIPETKKVFERTFRMALEDVSELTISNVQVSMLLVRVSYESIPPPTTMGSTQKGTTTTQQRRHKTSDAARGGIVASLIVLIFALVDFCHRMLLGNPAVAAAEAVTAAA
eukprot:TRINITY_DN16283_c0_g1_i1.p1 TRINITY_DN16283_c0_g1~~TRINITY_DN16283_c0_g1_i1.p1  ORF type:complete len:2041 (-),score=288.33 TRINITY_DN16283_c0_g1_i1:88-5571(-)